MSKLRLPNKFAGFSASRVFVVFAPPSLKKNEILLLASAVDLHALPKGKKI